MGGIFIYARVVDYASRAALDSASQLISFGDPVVCFLEPSSADVASAQLIGGAKHFISREINVALGWLVEDYLGRLAYRLS